MGLCVVLLTLMGTIVAFGLAVAVAAVMYRKENEAVAWFGALVGVYVAAAASTCIAMVHRARLCRQKALQQEGKAEPGKDACRQITPCDGK